jgi:Family of unknown function (DUF5955)
MHGSQIQQGTVRSEQHGTFGDQPDFDQLRSVAEKLRAILPTLDLGDDDRQEAEAELSTAEIQLGSNRPKLEIIRASLGRLAGLLGTASSAATNSVELTQALETLHKELPGI